MEKSSNDFNRDPETIGSLRRCFYKYLREDLPLEQKEVVKKMVDLILDISEGEFKCKSCQKGFKLFGFNLTGIFW